MTFGNLLNGYPPLNIEPQGDALSEYEALQARARRDRAKQAATEAGVILSEMAQHIAMPRVFVVDSNHEAWDANERLRTQISRLIYTAEWMIYQVARQAWP